MLPANGLVLTNAYNVDPEGEQLEETDGSFSGEHFNVFWEGKILGTYTGSTYSQANWHFALNDWLGNKRQITAYDGTAFTSFSSGPFGDYQLQYGSGLDPSEHHFTGKERDAESGLDYFGARYNNSNMGRFLSPDWNSAPDTVPYADFNNPQSLNLYSYAGNNPLSNVDPDGHTYHICDENGQNCSDQSDAQFAQNQANAGADGERYSNGNIYLSDGSLGGTYQQTDVDLPGNAASNQAGANMIGNGGMGMVNMFMRNMAYTIAGGLVGRGVGLGVEALTDGVDRPSIRVQLRCTVRLMQQVMCSMWASRMTLQDVQENMLAGSQSKKFQDCLTSHERMRKLLNKCSLKPMVLQVMEGHC